MIQSYLTRSGRGAAGMGVSGRSRPRGRIRFLALVALLAVFVGLAIHPTDAQAFTADGHGSYGRVGVPVARVGFSSIAGVLEQIRVPQRLITESPAYANRDQYVCIKHRTWELDFGQWYLKNVTKNCGWLYASQTGIYDRGYWSPYNPITGTFLGYDVIVTWQLRSGLQVGYRHIDYEVGNGYDLNLQCANHFTVHCSADNVHDAIAIF